MEIQTCVWCPFFHPSLITLAFCDYWQWMSKLSKAYSCYLLFSSCFCSFVVKCVLNDLKHFDPILFISVRDPHQQLEGDHTVTEAETPQHSGAKRSSCWQPAREVKHIHAHTCSDIIFNIHHLWNGLLRVAGCWVDTWSYLFFCNRVWFRFSLFLVMSYCEQDLASLLENMQTPFSEAQVGHIPKLNICLPFYQHLLH